MRAAAIKWSAMVRSIAASVVVFVLFAGCQTAAPTSPQTATATPIAARDLTTRPVIGKFGKPLGVVFEIEATIYRGSDIGTKMDDGRYLLRVVKVDGNPLPEPVLTEFAVPGFVRSDLASEEMELFEKTHPEAANKPMSDTEPAHGVSSDQIRDAEKRCVGKTVHLSVWETGRFSGIPSNMPKHAPVWQDTGFWFFTEVLVLVDHDKQ
jgi:hypothetical protein